jgi:hypothetical protein
MDSVHQVIESHNYVKREIPEVEPVTVVWNGRRMVVKKGKKVCQILTEEELTPVERLLALLRHFRKMEKASRTRTSQVCSLSNQDDISSLGTLPN